MSSQLGSNTIRRVMVGTDRSETADRAVRWAAGFADRYDAVPGGASNEQDLGIRTVLFTDIVGSTTLTQHVGDDAAMVLICVQDEIGRAHV